MKYFEYLSAKRKEKIAHRLNMNEIKLISKTKLAARQEVEVQMELQTRTLELERQAKCQHKFSHEIITKSLGVGAPNPQYLILFCEKCGLLKKERL